MTNEKKQLLIQLYDALLAGVESLEEENIGADGFYLTGAILKNTQCEWDDDRPILRVLKAQLGDDHSIWNYIQVVPQQG